MAKKTTGGDFNIQQGTQLLKDAAALQKNFNRMSTLEKVAAGAAVLAGAYAFITWLNKR